MLSGGEQDIRPPAQSGHNRRVVNAVDPVSSSGVAAHGPELLLQSDGKSPALDARMVARFMAWLYG
ncbi:hypothetical protein AWB90_21260 [Mycobacterium paraense]|uniref:Uncharacterized protein n=1 Tax=Mycobacterium paraense TaxID=767916 RepID=A0A1X2A6K8_9MYCO|nr:hypothetical protein AWB90_21260 [Mycobacterium paraense]